MKANGYIAMSIVREIRAHEIHARRYGWTLADLYRGLAHAMQVGDQVITVARERIVVARNGGTVELSRLKGAPS